MTNTQALLQKIQALPPERIAEVEDFVEFIAARAQGQSLSRALARAAAAASAPSFEAIWSNPEGDVYGEL